MNLSDIAAALGNLSPLEVVRYVRNLARKSRNGTEEYLHHAADNMVEKLGQQHDKEKELEQAGTPLSEDAQAEAIFNLHMEQLRDAFIAGGLFALRTYNYDIDGGLDRAEKAFEGLSPADQREAAKRINRERKAREENAGEPDELREVLSHLREGKSKGIGAMKIISGADGEGDIEFLGDKLTPEQAERMGQTIMAALKAAASGQKGPIQVGDVTLVPTDEQDLSKMN